MQQQVPLPQTARASERARNGVHEAAPDIAYQRIGFVNVVYCGHEGAGDRRWVLVDAGLPGSAGLIKSGAASRFGQGSRPYAIVLTHGHFDHVGAVRALAEEWDAPVFAHRLERPYLNGSREYPPPDAGAGGMMSWLSPLLPRGPIDIRDRLLSLPEDGSIPGMRRWRWLHTGGHTPGHVSLWREADRSLLSGDAVCTTRQESAYSAATQRPEMHGPPMYFTPDWGLAKQSVELLAALKPELIVPGHGRAMRGAGMRRALSELAERFDDVAVPRSARRSSMRDAAAGRYEPLLGYGLV